LPPSPFKAPCCGSVVDDLAFTDLGPLCVRCFQRTRLNGQDPEIIDPALWS
jgi:hypothetical protein